MNKETTLENFGEQKLKSLFKNGNPIVVKIRDLHEKKTSIAEIVEVAKIAAEQRINKRNEGFENEKQKKY